MLEVRAVSKFYGDKMAIQDISFTAEHGQIIGLLGHNGCGKSTTMNIIANCLLPSEGEVLLNGISVTKDPSAAKANIGYLPEVPPVYPDMTVEEQLSFACGLRGLPKREYEAQIRTVCGYLNIEGVRKRLIGNLSKGYRQRVGFAQALIGSPKLLILDEPTVGLDPKQILEIRDLIFLLKREHTVILSSHILSEIAATCDRIIVLSNGRLAADDTLAGLVRRAGREQELVLAADGEEERLLAVLRTIPDVEACTVEWSLLDGEREYHIRVRENRDIHRELFARLSEAGCPIRRLQPAQASLEEIFLRLTQDKRYVS